MPKRTAATRWEGSLMEGSGTMRLGSGAYEGPFSFRSRFENGDGTNPEELIAAAHAGCFSMMLLAELGGAGREPKSVEAKATVLLDHIEGGFAITKIELSCQARVPGIDEGSSSDSQSTPKRAVQSQRRWPASSPSSLTPSFSSRRPVDGDGSPCPVPPSREGSSAGPVRFEQ
jgi:osmotically inducible protein OsmC